MGRTASTLLPGPIDEAPYSLSAFLSELIAAGMCFSCGSTTDLLLDDAGDMFARCPLCGAEAGAVIHTGEETASRAA